MSRYCIFRYRVIMTRYRVIFHDIGPDIVNFCADIVTISCHTRSLPYTIFFISCPISCFFPISDTISGQYRDIPVPCHTRYRVFHRYHARYGPDIAINIRIYRCRVQKNTMSLPMCMHYYAISQHTDVGYFRCRVFSDIEDDISPAQAAPPPHGQTLQPVKPLGHQLCRPKGQCLGYCLHPSAQHATAEKGQGLGWCPGRQART